MTLLWSLSYQDTSQYVWLATEGESERRYFLQSKKRSAKQLVVTPSEQLFAPVAPLSARARFLHEAANKQEVLSAVRLAPCWL